MIEDLGGKQIFSTELVNCLPNGKIQTVNSMKYPTREIKVRFHIDFKYHHLRHTYGTLMAEMNTPRICCAIRWGMVISRSHSGIISPFQSRGSISCKAI